MEKLSQLQSDGHISLTEMNRQYRPLSKTVQEIIAAEDIEDNCPEIF